MTAQDVAKIAKREREAAEAGLKRHARGCLACHRWLKDSAGAMCVTGQQFADHADRMRKQEELSKVPPQTEYVQDVLF